MSPSQLTPITEVRGSCCVVRGDDIDTDRIIPARFMKEITFDSMGEHLFEDARKAAKGNHPLDDERFFGSEILLVGKNFGCGSSREHAPQALMRYGFRAFIGESFADIFAGNCCAMGLVCITLPAADAETLRESVELDPDQAVSIDVATQSVTCRSGKLQGSIPEGTRDRLLEGHWNATSLLLDAQDLIEAAAEKLGYMRGY
ncbi:MAG: 3-isopropylmalate dehydratase small subunit [Myxococcota bacterium]|nr:3-isopropylmalate dehydratase small subunit [Myxococcota bacterium]